MILFIANLILSFILWLFAYTGIKQYEFANQDGDTKIMKLLIHLVLIASLTVSSVSYFSSERSPVVPNTTMVEEIKK